MKLTVDIFKAEKELRCDITKKWIKEGKDYKFIWIDPYGKTLLVKKHTSKRKIKQYIRKEWNIKW